ncbi:hypothetical protein RRG08_050051 [Elysia crispata]|uniref:VWFC domain-containing protein n=1 Tax=Elysia crispata TaxID=231223 RepID=A0AAE1BAA1_9GAST|nr:hypothetical protein RRG08_050051 [Elysia crispata]
MGKLTAAPLGDQKYWRKAWSELVFSLESGPGGSLFDTVRKLSRREIFPFKLKMISLLCILAFGLSAVSGLSPVPNSTEVVPTPKNCTYNGVIYISKLSQKNLRCNAHEFPLKNEINTPGEKFSPDPCTFCECDDSGQHVCAKAGCAPPPCVDPVSRPDKCCAFCLNGTNCLAPDDEVIKQGDFHITDKGAVCHCPVHFWGPPRAICCHLLHLANNDDLPVC